MRKITLIVLTVLPLAMLSGCNLFEVDPKVTEAKDAAKAAIEASKVTQAKLDDAMAKFEATAAIAAAALAEVIRKFEVGDATEEDVGRAKALYDAAIAKGEAQVKSARAKHDRAKAIEEENTREFEAAVEEASKKYDNLGKWGATIGSMFGPQGIAIGGTVGTILGGIFGWIKTRKMRGLIAGFQATREAVHRNDPKAGAALDEQLRKLIPKEIQRSIKKMKNLGVIEELPGNLGKAA